MIRGCVSASVARWGFRTVLVMREWYQAGTGRMHGVPRTMIIRPSGIAALEWGPLYTRKVSGRLIETKTGLPMALFEWLLCST